MEIKIKCINENVCMAFEELQCYGEHRGLVPQEVYDNGYSYTSSEPSTFTALKNAMEHYQANYERYKGGIWLVKGFYFHDTEVHVLLVPKNTPRYSEVSFS